MRHQSKYHILCWIGIHFIVVGTVNLISYLVKYKCQQRNCGIAPALMIAQSDNNDSSDNCGDKGTVEEHETPADDGEEPGHCPCPLIGAYMIYFRQYISLGGLGISLLHLNVMTMGDMMTSHLLWHNLSPGWTGLTWGASAISGVIGTFAFSWPSKRCPLRTTAILSIGCMAACLSVSFIGTSFMSNDAISPIMVVVGVVVRRMGLH